MHILKVGNAIRPISMGFHAKTKPLRSGNSEGVLVLVLTALAHQAVKPLAEIVCYYFRCNGDDRRQRRKQGGAVGAAASRMRAAAKQTLGAATRAVASRSDDGEVVLRSSFCPGTQKAPRISAGGLESLMLFYQTG